LRLRPEAPARERRGAPVGKVGAVEARLEELVLDEQSHTGRQGRVDLAQSRAEARVTLRERVLARVVRAVREPEADDRRPQLVRDRDALAAVIERARSYEGIRIAEAPERVRVVAEEVGIDRADPDPVRVRIVAESAPVVDEIPRNVE